MENETESRAVDIESGSIATTLENFRSFNKPNLIMIHTNVSQIHTDAIEI